MAASLVESFEDSITKRTFPLPLPLYSYTVRRHRPANRCLILLVGPPCYNLLRVRFMLMASGENSDFIISSVASPNDI